jgi:hypothetical protein
MLRWKDLKRLPEISWSAAFISLSLLVLCGIPVQAQELPECQEEQQELCDTEGESIEPVITRTLGGPDQVENRLHIDSSQVTPMFPSNFAQGYYNWKNRIK